jgi:nucleoside-diphosphate-sugar epimerase
VRVVVTGASGNIGTALLRRWHEAGDVEVLAVCRRPPWAVGRQPEPAYQAATWTALDVADPAAPHQLEALMRGADHVVHLAWRIQPGHDVHAMRAVNVRGSDHVLASARTAGVPHLVHLSSVAAYGPRTTDEPQDESAPLGGVPGSPYSQHKAAVERLVDADEASGGVPTLCRMRPPLVSQHDAAGELARFAVGWWVPAGTASGLPIPLPRGLIMQAVHADDVAQAVDLAVRSSATGAFNVGAEEVLTGAEVARCLRGSGALEVPPRALRAAMGLGFALRAQPLHPSWLDLAMAAPMVTSERARRELGWMPQHSTRDALRALADGLHDTAGTASHPLRPRRALTGRRLGRRG